jgi:hypothetical protein
MESSGEPLNINDLPRWIVCGSFPRAGYRHGVLMVGTKDQQEALLKRGASLLRQWAYHKGLDHVDAQFFIHPESEKENCRNCFPVK